MVGVAAKNPQAYARGYTPVTSVRGVFYGNGPIVP
jgi:hypothetical protein